MNVDPISNNTASKRYECLSSLRFSTRSQIRQAIIEINKLVAGECGNVSVLLGVVHNPMTCSRSAARPYPTGNEHAPPVKDFNEGSLSGCLNA